MRALLLCAAVLVLTTPAARAAEYELVDRSPDATLESGEQLSQFVVLRNTGAADWTDVTLDGTFLSRNPLVAVTAPGAIARIDFDVRAPDVPAPQTFQAELTASSVAGRWSGPPVTIGYTVIPFAPPAIAITDITFGADRSTLDVTAQVTDNVALGHVELAYGDQVLSDPVPEVSTYRATFRTQACATLRVSALDRAGNPAATQLPNLCTPEPAATPRPKATAIVARWRTNRRGSQVASLIVKATAEGGTAVVTCKGGGCPFSFKRAALLPGRDADLLKLLKHARLRPRTVLEVRATVGGGVTSARYTIRKGRTPAVLVRCAKPGPRAESACS